MNLNIYKAFVENFGKRVKSNLKHFALLRAIWRDAMNIILHYSYKTASGFVRNLT
jgi:hypothetical protein